ncbi:hypothetical protein FHS01_003690 [Longimicrobium terrae]|uniref:Uncharacterized protein n=1 Tax=Longimicrobium terrae TaxID=1639882 RepID=A0A841H2D2_9BACT|nr:hypothetical protein [Longimicrobium terrae]MBB6072029.1 hypothetical protein [Longimicrobium terrae]
MGLFACMWDDAVCWAESRAAPTRAGTTGPPSPKKDWGRVGAGRWGGAVGEIRPVPKCVERMNPPLEQRQAPTPAAGASGSGLQLRLGIRQPVRGDDFVYLEAQFHPPGRSKPIHTVVGPRSEVSPSPACGRGGRGVRAARGRDTPCGSHGRRPLAVLFILDHTRGGKRRGPHRGAVGPSSSVHHPEAVRDGPRRWPAPARACP